MRILCLCWIGLALVTMMRQQPAKRAAVPAEVSKWIAVAPPKPGSGEWYAAINDLDHEWILSLVNGRVVARARKEHRPPRPKLPFEIARTRDTAGEPCAFKTSDGWLIGFNAGEWGGSLNND